MKTLCWLNHTHLGERQGNLFRKLKHRQNFCVFQGPLGGFSYNLQQAPGTLTLTFNPDTDL